MAIFSATDIAEFAALKDELAYADDYRIERAVVIATDTRNNRTFEDQTVEEGTCRLRADGIRPQERIIADRLGWTVSAAIDLPYDTLATPDDRILIQGRTFHIGGVIREGNLGIDATAVCEERSH